MKIKKGVEKDEIFKQKKENSITAVSFLSALKSNLDFDLAFEIAKEAFEKYMTQVYEPVFASTKEGSQERFDCLRKAYEDYTKKVPYCKVIESNSNILKAKFERCPFFEVLSDFALEDFGYAFCLSDPAFTKKLLPGVKFSRKHLIAKGDSYCDNTWEFNI